MGIIEDGSGTGRKAKVDSVNRLHTETISLTEEAYVSQVTKQAFCGTLTDAQQITNPQGIILYLKNTSTSNNLVIEKLMVSTSADDTQIYCRRNDTGIAATTTDVNVVNLNFGSGITAESTLQTTSGTSITGLTEATGGGEIARFNYVNKGFNPFPIDGTFVLEKNNVFTVGVSTPVSGTVGWTLRYRFVPPRSD